MMYHHLQPVHWSRAGDVPSTYVTTTLDRPVPHDLQLETGHIPAVTHPERFAETVREAAAS